jgi:hypothetical protein
MTSDLKAWLERAIKDIDRRVKEVRTLRKGAATLSEKLASQKDQRYLEAQRDELEKQLTQQIIAIQLFAAEWEVL